MSDSKPAKNLDAISEALIDLALAEDLGTGDVTTDATVSADTRSQARIFAKQDLVFSGAAVLARVFARVDSDIELRFLADEGARIRAGQNLAELRGPSRSLLIGERLALNFVMHLSGIATQAAELMQCLEKFPQLRLLDTRKTTPGMRALEKQAVRSGGAHNHRFALYDGVLIKENHIMAAGSIAAAVQGAKAKAHHLLKIEVEVTGLEELRLAVEAGADALLLDNMDNALTRQAVQQARALKPDIFLEASGNMSAERLADVAACGVDAISMGALTHSVAGVDISMRFDEP